MTTWTDEQRQLYELASETIGNIIAWAARDLADERHKARPDKTRIHDLVSMQAQLDQERRNLRITDERALRAVIDKYGPQHRDRMREEDERRRSGQVPAWRATGPAVSGVAGETVKLPLKQPAWVTKGPTDGVSTTTTPRRTKPTPRPR